MNSYFLLLLLIILLILVAINITIFFIINNCKKKYNGRGDGRVPDLPYINNQLIKSIISSNPDLGAMRAIQEDLIRQGASLDIITSDTMRECIRLQDGGVYGTIITIPPCVRKIGFMAFSRINITGTLVIPQSVKVIGPMAFVRCDNRIKSCKQKKMPDNLVIEGWEGWANYDSEIDYIRLRIYNNTFENFSFKEIHIYPTQEAYKFYQYDDDVIIDTIRTKFDNGHIYIHNSAIKSNNLIYSTEGTPITEETSITEPTYDSSGNIIN